MISGNYGPCTVFRDGVAIADVNGPTDSSSYIYSYRDLYVKAGQEPSYTITFPNLYGTKQIGPKSTPCLKNYFADLSQTTVELDLAGDEKSVSVIGKKEVYDSRKKTITVSSISWSAVCASKWLRIAKNQDGNVLQLSADVCPNVNGRRSVVRVVIEGYVVKYIHVAQGCEAREDDVVVDVDAGDMFSIPRNWFTKYPSYEVNPYMVTGKTDWNGCPMFCGRITWQEQIRTTLTTFSTPEYRSQMVW